MTKKGNSLTESEVEEYPKCFHCLFCGYLQCCDWDGFYKKARKMGKEKYIEAIQRIDDSGKSMKTDCGQ